MERSCEGGGARDATPRAGLLAALQTSGGHEYDARTDGAAGPVRERAVNPAEHAQVEFLDDGVRVAAERAADGAMEPTTSIALRLARLGREGTLIPVPLPNAPISKGNRVEYRRRGTELTEWYVNGPLGLEQGFTVGARPKGAGPLVLELALAAGIEPRLSSDGGVDLYASSDGHGGSVPAGRYFGLHVEDARGQPLDARLAVVGGAIAITVDDLGRRIRLWWIRI